VKKLDSRLAYVLVLEGDSQILPDSQTLSQQYNTRIDPNLNRDKIRQLARGCEQLIDLVLGEPINVRRLSYVSNSISNANVPLRQMLNISNYQDIKVGAQSHKLPAIQEITYSFAESLSLLSLPPHSPQNLFYCVDQCENIYEQITKFKLEPKNFNKDEILAILVYINEISPDYKNSSPLWHCLNTALLINDESYYRYLSLLRRAFNKVELKKQTVYKGILPNPENNIYCDPFKTLPVNYKFQWRTYTRCTRLMDLAKMYATTSPAGIIIEIENATTLSFQEFANIISEDELLLSPNAVYTVITPLHRIEGHYWCISLRAEQEGDF